MAVLEVDDVSVTFGGLAALIGVDVVAEAGAVTGLIGPNGAGKTTLFNVICGLQRAKRGHVVLDGRDVTGARTFNRARRGLARTFQRLEVFGSLTTRENLLVAAEMQRNGRDPHAVAQEILSEVGLTEYADVHVDSIPTGLARLVELGRALATDPKVLLLDEPSSGLDEAETDAFGELLLRLAERGLAVLLVEHDVELVMRVCSQIYVLDFGEIIASGSPDEIRRSAAVQTAYLGSPLSANGSGR
ncbi:MAG: lptB 2 [Actinomycetia bacterium]|nr:lptB 2 [Actinomycetes bacterium]